MWSLLRLLALLVWRLLLLCGWIAFGLLAGLFLAETTGLLSHIASNLARSAAGDVAVQVGSAGVRWFPSRIVLEDVRYGPEPHWVVLPRVELEWRLDFNTGFQLEAIHAHGGRALLCDELFQAKDGARSAPAESNWTGMDLSIDALELRLASERWGALPLGRLDVAGRLEPGSYLSWRGRLRPPFSPDGTRQSEIFVTGAYQPGVKLELESSGAALPLSLSYLPEGEWLERLRAWQPRGTFDIHAQLQSNLASGGQTQASVRARVSDANALLGAGQQSLSKLNAELELRLDGALAAQVWELAAWKGRFEAQGQWESAQVACASELANSRWRGHADVQALALDERIVDLAGGAASLREIWRSFAPRGSGALWLAWDWQLTQSALEGLRLAAEFAPQGQTGMTYLGWPLDQGRGAGFPLPADAVQGRVVLAREPSNLRPLRTGLIDLRATTPAGAVQCDGLISSHAVDAPPFLPGAGASELDLSIQSSSLQVGEALYAALRGLEPTVPARTSWLPFDPQGGELGARFRLVRRVDMPYAAVEVDAQLRGVNARWEELPVPVRNLRGQLRMRTDGKGAVGASFDALADLNSVEHCQVQARLQTDPLKSAGELDEWTWIAVALQGAALGGSDAAVLAQQFPEVGQIFEQLRPKGLVDARYERTRTGRSAPVESHIEIMPRWAELDARAFPLPLRELQGRLLLSQSGEQAMQTALSPIVASASGDARLAFEARFPDPRLDIWAAGLEPNAPGLREALSQALGASGPSDLGEVSMEGPLDLQANLLLQQPVEIRARIDLRENSLRVSSDLELTKLAGMLEYRDGVIQGEHIQATLGRTPMELRTLRFEAPKTGFRLSFGLSAEDLPLDRQHLAGFIDASTLDALLGELALEGRMDVDDAHVLVLGTQGAAPSLEFSGLLTPSNTSLELGLPVRIGSARVRIERLLLEDQRLRANARVEELYGDIAGRVLGPASLRLSYIEPLLSIEDVEATLEDGRMQAIGASGQRSGSAFTINLAPPYDFQLGLALKDVEVGGLLRGLFDSEFATKGRLEAEIRLEGNTEQLLGIEGNGSVRVRDSKLWSIPVFRALFSQLGLDSAVVFENMQARFSVRNGRIELRNMSVASPILELVGSKGVLDFDGALKFDLELRYALIDRLGPITRLFYSIQNRLMSVEIRGDMARPFVEIKNPLSSLFGRSRRPRQLPLPGFSPLPSRF